MSSVRVPVLSYPEVCKVYDVTTLTNPMQMTTNESHTFIEKPI